MQTAELKKLFHKNHGQIRMKDAMASGISRTKFYAWRAQGLIEPVTRGIYRLSSLPKLSHPDFVAVSLRFPQGVICLLSALSYYQLTTHIPHTVDVAVSRKARFPHSLFPPVQAHRFSDPAFSAGIQIETIDDVPIRFYNPEKTLVDCFKFRHKIGLDIFLEALKRYKEKYPLQTNRLFEYAKLCRVEKIMLPYLESLLCL